MVLGLICLGQTTRAEAAILRIGASQFQPDAGLITFSELPLNTQNPTYSPTLYGAQVTAPTVYFGGIFSGQFLGSGCPPGAIPSGCVTGNPVAPLSLITGPPITQIVQDISNPTSPVLSGMPLFNGPVSILFSRDIAAVGLQGGYFNAIAGTAITAFARDGSRLGSVTNESLEIEFLALASATGQDQIAGLQFSLVGPEPAGFAIDNLRFAQRQQVNWHGLPIQPPASLSSFQPMGQPPSVSYSAVSLDKMNGESNPVPVENASWGAIVLVVLAWRKLKNQLEN